MFEKVTRVMESLSPLKGQEPIELLRDMRLRPDISVMLSETLNLPEGDIYTDKARNPLTNVTYDFHLIKLNRMNLCLLQIPTAISKMECSDQKSVYYAIEAMMESLLMKFEATTMRVFMIYEQELNEAFYKYPVVIKITKKVIAQFIPLRFLEAIKKEEKDMRRIILIDKFDLDRPPIQAGLGFDAAQNTSRAREHLEFTGKQLEQLIIVLCSAFDKNSLKQMLFVKLEKKLDEIVSEGNYKNIVFELVKVAEMEGWLKKLISAAWQSNQNNPELQSFVQNLGIDLTKSPKN